MRNDVTRKFIERPYMGENNLMVTSYMYVGLTGRHTGAGDGAVTSQMAPLFRRDYTTEMSPPMTRKLMETGYT